MPRLRVGYAFIPTTSAVGGAKEKVLYSFKLNDAHESLGNLIDVKGTLYVDLSTSKETMLYSFGTRADGAAPYASLIDVKGMLYGTTLSGGASGNGTIFAVDPSTGTEKVVYSFAGGTGWPKALCRSARCEGYAVWHNGYRRRLQFRYGFRDQGALMADRAPSMHVANGTIAV